MQERDAEQVNTQVSTDEDELRADYAAWRDRMKQKSARSRSRVSQDTKPAASPTPGPIWNTDTLYRDSARVAEEEAEDLEHFKSHDHLAVLDLRESATDVEIATAYRNLAKLHHPDRWVDADAETREHHALCMRNINEAYQTLRANQRTEH
jgi:hypothetical protein